MAPGRDCGRAPDLRLARIDRAEEPVRFVVRARGEEERPARACADAVAELERPEPVDCERLAIGSAQLAAVLEVAVRLQRVGVYLAVAEVADKQVVGEPTKARRSHCEPPRSVQLAVLRDSGLQGAGRVVGVDKAEPL